MTKKREKEAKTVNITPEVLSQRRDIMDLCYKRLREIIPECTNEVTLIKCIEILDKREDPSSEESGQKALCSIAATLDRLSEIKRI